MFTIPRCHAPIHPRGQQVFIIAVTTSDRVIHSIIEYMAFADAEDALKKLDGVDLRGSIVRINEGQAPPGQSWSNPVSGTQD